MSYDPTLDIAPVSPFVVDPNMYDVDLPDPFTPTTPSRLKALILRELGDVNENLGDLIDALWEVNSRYAATSVPMHQYYATKLSAIQVLMGDLLTPTTEGTQSQNAKNRLAVLQAIQQQTMDILTKAVQDSEGMRVPVVAKLYAIAPIGPSLNPNHPGELIDANDRRLMGDAYLRPFSSRGNGLNGYEGF